MHHSKRYRGGFTLVEIMVVVVIIGLLVAMAVPAWQKVRLTSIASTMDNDARQLASAAQQYFMENQVATVSVTYTAGVITGPLADRVRFVGRQYTAVSNTLTPTDPFSLTHPAFPAAIVYDSEGHRVP